MSPIEMASIIRALQENGTVMLAPLARSRALRDDFAIQEIHDTIAFGKVHACREPDRVKFVDEVGVVFVAYTEPPNDTPGAVIVGAFKLRAHND